MTKSQWTIWNASLQVTHGNNWTKARSYDRRGGRGRLVATCYSPGWRPQIMNGHGAQQCWRRATQIFRSASLQPKRSRVTSKLHKLQNYKQLNTYIHYNFAICEVYPWHTTAPTVNWWAGRYRLPPFKTAKLHDHSWSEATSQVNNRVATCYSLVARAYLSLPHLRSSLFHSFISMCYSYCHTRHFLATPCVPQWTDRRQSK